MYDFNLCREKNKGILDKEKEISRKIGVRNYGAFFGGKYVSQFDQ